MVAKALDLTLDPRTFARRLDAAESLAPGSGMLELKAYARPTSAGAAVDYTHRLSDQLAAFATAYGGVTRDRHGTLDPEWGALAGLRWRW